MDQMQPEAESRQWHIKKPEGYVIGVWAIRAEDSVLPSGLSFVKLYEDGDKPTKMIEGTLVRKVTAIVRAEIEAEVVAEKPVDVVEEIEDRPIVSEEEIILVGGTSSEDDDTDEILRQIEETLVSQVGDEVIVLR